ncbi:glycoside hydrolase family 43 protein [Paenibacillus sp. Leaf72]|uniref:glycoside hydrolase family 43 protein n=1 Tax=Paenibacillus sp. Leaf72 TaxID=1736234 RepID=UPI0007002D60|nr:glycoside hydrolase family 43 protein [Paenibacillus sp. Leaf72]KQN96084.1 beta-xylosidase [Paenibacillus sp. Leaf72]
MIINPILKGFNPDPSIIRVEDDYYIATSTFEWFPGVQIHHSKDLINWRLLTHPLTRVSQLDLRGKPSSGGIWAPNLTYDNGTFYLLITDVVARKGPFKDLHNYLVTASDILGPWSEPIYLNSSGFDPAMLHDDDGRKWLFNMKWDFRPGKSHFAGIVMQEFSPEQGKLVGEVRHVFSGTDIGLTEGPNVYKKDGYYYMLCAEGGTGYNHAGTLARSRTVEGPYEADPHYPLLTTVNDPEHPLLKAGHGALVETQHGDWYIAHLCARPLKGRMLSPLGRETALQKVEWTDEGWLRLAGGGRLPQVEVKAAGLKEHPFEPEAAVDHFHAPQLNLHFSTLRVPADESWLSLKEQPGFLRLYGRESLYSLHQQSLVARRLQHYDCEIETCVRFEPEHFNQMAGLTLYYDVDDYFYLRISRDEKLGKHIALVTSKQGHYEEPEGATVVAEGWESCYLKAVIHDDEVHFYCSEDGEQWMAVGERLDLGQLSDEYEGKLGFMGTLAGMCVQDLNGTRLHADFDYFRYEPS